VLKQFYSTSDVASLFNINRVTIYRWVKEGKIKAYEIGKNIKIPASEIERLLKDFGFSGSDIQDIYGTSDDGSLNEHVRNMTEGQNEKKLVVAVDDDEGILEFIEGMFKKTDLGNICDLLTFSDSLEAAIQLGSKKPDLVLLDVRMSGMDGIDLATKVQAVYGDVKIVFISGYPEEKYSERIKQLDVFEYLVKPVDLNTLHTVICNVLKL